MSDEQLSNDMQELIGNIGDTWKSIYEVLQEDSTPAEPHLNGATYDEVGESILTILVWMRSLKNIKKNSPKTYRLARAALLSRSRGMYGRLIKIQAGEYSNFSLLMNDIATCLSMLATLTIVSRKREAIAEGMTIGGLAQNLAELKEKYDLVDSLHKKIEETASMADSIVVLEQEAKKNCLIVNQIYKSAEQTSDILGEKNNEIKSLLVDAVASVEQMDSNDKYGAAVVQDLEKLSVSLEEADKSAKDKLKTIETLLPKATSAGLAASFGDRERIVSKSVKWWVIGFFSGIGLLVAGILGSMHLIPAQPDQIDWLTLARRLMFAAPGVWVAWYCARGISTAIKLRESYAFKKAISRAYEGYKNQMVQLDDQYENSDLAGKLSNIALAVIAADPVAILSKPEEEGHSPWESAINSIRRRKRKNKPIKDSDDIESNRSDEDSVGDADLDED